MRITYVQVRWVCDACGGDGEVPTTLPYCGVCSREYTHAELGMFAADSGWDDLLPCGHWQRDLREHRNCIECHGKGWGEGWVPFEEFRSALAGSEATA